jgi:hypothetical protein
MSRDVEEQMEYPGWRSIRAESYKRRITLHGSDPERVLGIEASGRLLNI